MTRAETVAGTGPSHPVALGMTALLLLNDHVLKAAWPGWWTGKLSDVAFLVVAPVALAALLAAVRVPDRPARHGAAVAVGLFFVVLQLWAPLGDTVASWLGGRHVADPTDLLTLPALALCWLAWRPTPPVPLALPIAALACVATSWHDCPDERYPAHGAWLDPNEPLLLSFGSDTPPPDHPALARNVRVLDPEGQPVELLFANGITVCPVGGLRPDTTYTFVIDNLTVPGSNTTTAWFASFGETTFTTRSTSELAPITTMAECEQAQILGAFDPCGFEDDVEPDTGMDTSEDPIDTADTAG